jgi:hypothetical protein
MAAAHGAGAAAERLAGVAADVLQVFGGRDAARIPKNNVKGTASGMARCLLCCARCDVPWCSFKEHLVSRLCWFSMPNEIKITLFGLAFACVFAFAAVAILAT